MYGFLTTCRHGSCRGRITLGLLSLRCTASQMVGEIASEYRIVASSTVTVKHRLSTCRVLTMSRYTTASYRTTPLRCWTPCSLFEMLAVHLYRGAPSLTTAVASVTAGRWGSTRWTLCSWLIAHSRATTYSQTAHKVGTVEQFSS